MSRPGADRGRRHEGASTRRGRWTADDAARPTSAPPPTPPATAGSRPAVITTSGQVVTFAELEERSARLAQALYAHGLRPGDHVAVLLPNDHRTHEVVFGLQRSGVYYTLANTHLTAEEAAYIVNDCGAHTLITSDALAPLADELVASDAARRAAPDAGGPRRGRAHLV